MFLTPWVKRLLIANAVMFLLPQGSSLYFNLSFVPGLAIPRPWTLVTYMFLHAGIMHLAFNMLVLFFFGPRLESRLGSRDFLWLYVLSGIGGAVLSMPFQQNVQIVGASGAVYGVVLGFAYFWPREKILIWGVFPVEAWVLAMFAVFISLWNGIAGTGGNVAHFAHLGGLAVAYLFLKYRERRTAARKKRWMEGADAGERRPRPKGSTRVQDRWQAIERDRLHELNREEVDSLLDKIGTHGVGSLTPEERSFLDRMAERYGKSVQ